MFNLDNWNKEELNQLYMRVSNHPRICAKKYGYTVKDMKHLSNYAMNRLVAMQLREIGKNDTALVYESICKKIYSCLSESAKW